MSAYEALAQWYDELTGDVPYEEFADYFERIFREKGRRGIKTVLDMACGTGTLTCLLAERGYETIAVDSSEEMLEQLSEKAAGLSGVIQPLVICQELCELDLYGTVDAAVCSLDGMNYVPPEELPELFRRLRLFVEPDGLILFDLNTPERLKSLDGEIFVDEADDLLCLWRAEFDEDEGCLVYGMDIFSKERSGLWRRDGEEHIEFAHEPEKICALLERAGFHSMEILTDCPQSGEGRIFIIAQNREH